MQILIWAAMFLLLAVVGSTVALAGMIGLPIDGSVQAGVIVMTALVVVSGLALLNASPPATPTGKEETPSHFHHA